MAEVQQQSLPAGPAVDAAKVLEKGDTVPKIMDEKNIIVDKKEVLETKAPPSTPTSKTDGADKAKDEEEGEKKPAAKKEPQSYSHFPRFKVTWDSTVPSVNSLKSPGKKKGRNSQSTMAERPSVLTAQEMSPQATLVEFIVTSASYHGVRRQNLSALEDELFRVFRNNVMPANAAAWYMAKRRFFTNTSSNQNQLLPTLLKEYPKKFAIKNNVVQFLENYSPSVARNKMKYLVEQGLFAYFSHKVDEHGVYFFDPLYYEETEPFHANLRLVTNIYNNQKAKLIPAYFKKYKKQFHYKQISPFLVAISKIETEVISGITGVVITMFDKKHGLIRFNRNAESCVALFSTSALFHNGYKLNADPKSLPPVLFDAYKIPENERVDKFKWFAVLTWVGRRPNPKFCATKAELTNCPQYKTLPVDNAASNMKRQDEIDYMKMGVVREIRKNGAVAVVKEEGDDKEQKFFIPGWSFIHTNTAKVNFLTTTKGVGLAIGDLVNFYIDPNMHAKPYEGVACNVDVFKHAQVPLAKPEKRTRKKSTASTKSGGKGPNVNWKKFIMEAEIADEVASDIDPDWVPPKDMDEGSDDDSDISEDEVKELLESKDKELDEVLKDQAKVPDAAEEELPAKIESLKITEEVTKVAPAAAVAEAQVTSTTS